MTPTMITGFGLASPMFLPEPLVELAALSGNAAPAPRLAEFAVITVGSQRQAQGPVLRRHRNGRVSIDAGGRVLTGIPVNARVAAAGARPWWSRMGHRPL